MDPLIICIGLYFLAILLAVIDVFLPTGGILLILSGIAAVGAILFGFREGTTTGLIVTIIVLASIPVIFYAAIKLWPHTPIGRRILLSPPNSVGSSPMEQIAGLIGIVVKNTWPLAPMGQIKIGSQRYSARSSDGRLIDPGTRVKVIDYQEGILVVLQTNEPLTESDPFQKSMAAAPQSVDLEERDLLEKPASELGLNDLDELPLNELPLDEDR